MRLLKGFMITIVGFFIVITLVSLLMPSNVITSRTVNIAARPEDVRLHVSDLKNWRTWHPLFSAQQIEISASGNGQVAEWISAGKKNQLVVNTMSADEIRFTVFRPGENKQENKISLLQVKDSNNVQVEWSALTRLKWYPWEKFSGIFVDKITGAGYEAALSSLKNRLENPNRGN